jgi:dienelactone hydrolase
MKYVATLFLVLAIASFAHASGETVTYEINGEPFEGYFTSPSPNAPLVLLIHDWDGLTDYEVQRADMLAELGYATFAADLFGAGIRPEKVEDRRQHTGELYEDRQRMRALIQGALETAQSKHGNAPYSVAMGYCFGGAAVLEFARSGADMQGFVTFHGGLGTPEGQDYSNTQGHILVLHGTADTAITMEDFAALAVQLEEHGVSHEMISYSGAPHAFTVFGSDRYREDADRKSWARFTEFLEEVSN